MEAYGQQDTSSLKQIMLNLKEPSTQEETKTYKKQYNEKPIDSTVQARRNRAEILYKLLLDNKLVSQTISQMFCGDAHTGVYSNTDEMHLTEFSTHIDVPTNRNGNSDQLRAGGIIYCNSDGVSQG